MKASSSLIFVLSSLILSNFILASPTPSPVDVINVDTAPSEVLVKRIIERFRGPTGRTEPDLRRDPGVVVRVADTDVGPGSVPEGRLKVYAEEVLEGGKRLMKEAR